MLAIISTTMRRSPRVKGAFHFQTTDLIYETSYTLSGYVVFNFSAGTSDSVETSDDAYGYVGADRGPWAGRETSLSSILRPGVFHLKGVKTWVLSPSLILT
jgi:hypothetical protein